MNYKFYALIQGGIGPDVWDSEMEISAVDISDALRQAHSLAEELGGTVMEVTQSDWGSPIAGSITGLKRTLTRLNDRVHSGYDFNADPDNMTNEVCEALGGFYSIEIAELARLQSRLAECESLVVKKDEALKTCLEMFREIRGDWTDPRMECRAGADAAVAALALTPADCAGMECVPTGELEELRRDKERLVAKTRRLTLLDASSEVASHWNDRNHQCNQYDQAQRSAGVLRRMALEIIIDAARSEEEAP